MDDNLSLNNEDDIEQQDSITPRGLQVLNAVTGLVSLSEAGGSRTFVGKLGSLWDTSNNIAKDFVEEIEKKFERKNKLHAFFPENSLNKTPKFFKKLTNKDISFTKHCNELIKLIAIEVNRVGSGRLPEANVVFVHYKREFQDDEFGKFLIVMIKHTGAFEFNKSLQPKKLKRLDIESLLQAVSVDLNLFDIVYPKEEGEAYLNFIKGSQTSDFFKEALGCSNAIPNKRSLEQLNQAITDFINQEGIDRGLRKVLQKAVLDHIDEVMGRDNKEKRIVNLNEVVIAFEKHLPEDHKARNKLKDFVNSGGYEVSEIFEPTWQSINSIKKIKITDDGANFDCYFSEGAIGYEGEDKPILLAPDVSYVKIFLNESERKKLINSVGIYEQKDK